MGYLYLYLFTRVRKRSELSSKAEDNLEMFHIDMWCHFRTNFDVLFDISKFDSVERVLVICRGVAA